MNFYVGLHQPSDAWRFPDAMISVKRLDARRGWFTPPSRGWMLDSGAFSEIAAHGDYRASPERYAAQVVRWWHLGRMVSATSQDYMCEPSILARTGLSVADHQRLTIDRYDTLRALIPASIYLMPVIQGYTPDEYAACLTAYGDRLTPGMWTGVGSVCKRNGQPEAIAAVLRAIKAARPDLQLHGFGCKQTALKSADVRAMLHSADSMAWSYSARRQGRDANDWREAARFAARIEAYAARRRPMEELWTL